MMLMMEEHSVIINCLPAAATEKDKVAIKSENRRRSDSKPELGEGGEVAAVLNILNV